MTVVDEPVRRVTRRQQSVLDGMRSTGWRVVGAERAPDGSLTVDAIAPRRVWIDRMGEVGRLDVLSTTVRQPEAPEAERESVTADRGAALSPDERRAAAADLAEQGLSLRAIAAELAVSKDTVRRDLAAVER